MKNFKLFKKLWEHGRTLRRVGMVLALCLMTITQLWAHEREYDGTEKLYFKNFKPDGWGEHWISSTKPHCWVHLYNGSFTKDVKLTLHSGTAGQEGAIYVCTPPAGKYTNVILVRTNNSSSISWPGGNDQSKDIYVGEDDSKNMIDNLSPGTWGENYGGWTKYAPTPAVIGSMNGWKVEANPATSERTAANGDKIKIIPVTLAASTNYTFRVITGQDQYGKASLTITGATKDGSWESYSTGSSKDVTITSGEAGEYIFQFNTNSKYVVVYYPKARLAKNKVLYFDASGASTTYWNQAAFDSKFYFKYYDAGTNVDGGSFASQIAGTKIYYATVPNNDYVGQIIIDRYNPNDHNESTGKWNTSGEAYATGRSSSKENCFGITADGWSPSLGGWTTYCPPKSASTISDNSTVKYTVDGLEDGSSSHPYLVEKSGTIKVSAASTNYVSDGNMTTTYRFYDGSTALGTGTQTGTTYSYTASSTPNTVHQMKVNALNEYNGATSTDKFSSILYYKAVNCYTVTYRGNGSNSGSVPAVSGTKYAQGANVSVVGNTGSLGRSNYTFDGWNTAEHINGTAYSASSTISSIAANYDLYAKWNQSVSLDDNGGKGDGSSSVTMTYNCSSHSAITNPTRDGYTFAGWYEATDGNALVINTSGVLQANTSYTDASGYWTRSGSAPTLHAHWTANQYAISLNDRDATTASSTSTTLKATYDSNTLTATITNPEKDDYTFAGWYTNSDGTGSMVINTSGTLVSGVDGYTDGSGNWKKATGVTLYARWKADASVDAYNFQYGSGIYYSSSWTVANFGSATDHKRTVNFTMPDPDGVNYYVGYNGDFWSSGLGEGDTKAQSVENDLEDLIMLPSGVAIGDAEGATGKLVIWDNSSADNLYVGFEPDGYGLTYNTGTIAFGAADGSHMRQTSIVTLAAADVSGSFKVGLKKTSSGYVDCAKTATDNASALNTRAAALVSEQGYPTIPSLASGLKGRFVMWDGNNGAANNWYLAFLPVHTVTYYGNGNTGGSAPTDATEYLHNTNVTVLGNGTLVKAGYAFAGWNTEPDGEGVAYAADATISNIGANVSLYAQWTPVTLTFTSGLYWNSADNWSPACVPTIDHDVVIASNCWVTNANAKAKSVKINFDVRLRIEDNGGLVVAEDIKAQHEADGAYEATKKNDVYIETDNSGTGGLVCGSASTTTEVTYIFYSKSYRYQTWYINQYIGIPFAAMDPYDWYGLTIFEYDTEKDKWKTPVLDEDGNLKPFTAYNVISKISGSFAQQYYTEGILNLPGTSGTEVLTCGSRVAEEKADPTYPAHPYFDNKGDYMFANSWTAPISIGAIDNEDISGSGADLVQCIYIFNAGYVSSYDLPKELGEEAGQWSAFPIESADYMENAVIQAGQAFLVTSKAANATLTLDYGKHVYTPALNNGINLSPRRAPRRTNSIDDPNILKIVVNTDSAAADKVYLFERSDYTFGYDNGWDGVKIMGSASFPRLYALNGAEKMSVSAVPDVEGIELGFKAGTDTNAYYFSFEYNDSEPLYLYDRETQIFTRINNEASYEFTTDDTDEHARFIITRSNAPMIETGTETLKGEENRAEKFFENNMLFIRRGDKVYNVDGSLVK